MKINEKNLNQAGCIVGLNIGSGFQARTKLKKEELEGMDEKKKELVQGHMNLLGAKYKDLISELMSYDAKTRGHVKNLSIECGIAAAYFVLDAQIPNVLAWLNEREEGRKELLNNIITEYDNAVKEFSEEYPEMYEKYKDSYPRKEEIKKKHYFRKRLFSVTMPDEGLKNISEEEWKRAKEESKNFVENLKQEAMNVVYTELLEKTRNLMEYGLTDRKPNQKTFNFLDKFFERIDAVYSPFIERKDMKDLISKVKNEISGVSSDTLRNDEKFRKEFGKTMKKIVDDFKSMPDIETKRAIII